ncbi:MAG: hypothetical protein EOO06_12430 [Chitinophagaceae bacterium]|nr:MAG: hypothetical protein EOO06_12430 [Chitinophagaceae bacterium]
MQEQVTIDYLKSFLEINKDLQTLQQFPSLAPSHEQRCYRYFSELLDFYEYVEEAQNAVFLLEKVVSDDSNISQLNSWVSDHSSLFIEELMGFGLCYLDSGKSTFRKIYIPELDMSVDGKPFVPLVLFWESMWLLYFRDNARCAAVNDVELMHCYYKASGYEGELELMSHLRALLSRAKLESC